MSGAFEDDPAIDSTDYEPGDYREVREGPPPGYKLPPFSPAETEAVVTAARMLSQRSFRIRIVVEDAETGADLWWTRPNVAARLGDTISIEFPLIPETS